MEITTIVAAALDARTPTDPTEYDLDVVHPRLNIRGRCMSCGRRREEACDFPYDPTEINVRDGDITDYAGLIDVAFGADACVVIVGGAA